MKRPAAARIAHVEAAQPRVPRVVVTVVSAAGLLRDLVSDAVLGPDHLSLSLRLPVATSLPGRVTGRPHAAPVTIPAGQLRIATPRRRAA